MKKIVFATICILVFESTLFAQDCGQYKKGFFTYTDSSGTTILVDRSKKYQYQLHRAKKVRTQFRIKWIDDCTYTITQTITNSRSQKKYNSKVTKVVITKSDGENGYYYYYHCSCMDDTKKSENLYMKKISKSEFYKLY
jgi:hypothetical protein